jgi:hypothetical protein
MTNHEFKLIFTEYTPGTPIDQDNSNSLELLAFSLPPSGWHYFAVTSE